jgi:hypothetical protein
VAERPIAIERNVESDAGVVDIIAPAEQSMTSVPIETSMRGAASRSSRTRRASRLMAGETAISSAAERIWLECNAQLLDIGAVDVIGIRESMPGIELVQFTCPQCHSMHESLRFG